jgi:hypothetical protein
MKGVPYVNPKFRLAHCPVSYQKCEAYGVGSSGMKMADFSSKNNCVALTLEGENCHARIVDVTEMERHL